VTLVLINYLQVPLEDLHHASQLLVQALRIRERYMAISNQSFPTISARFLRSMDGSTSNPPTHYDYSLDVIQHDERKSIAGTQADFLTFQFMI